MPLFVVRKTTAVVPARDNRRGPADRKQRHDTLRHPKSYPEHHKGVMPFLWSTSVSPFLPSFLSFLLPLAFFFLRRLPPGPHAVTWGRLPQGGPGCEGKSWIFRFWAAPGGLETLKKCGAKPPTFLRCFQAGRGRPEPENPRLPLAINLALLVVAAPT